MPGPVEGTPLCVGPAIRWFSYNGGERVALATRKAPRLILAALIDQHETSPEKPLGVDALVAAGWPDQRIQTQAGADRVYMAVGTLRKMGLKATLKRRDDGYILRSDLRILRSD